MAGTKQVSDLIVKLMRMNTSNMLVGPLTELQRQFRAVESDMKLAENKVQQGALELLKAKKEIDLLKKKVDELQSQRQAPAPAAATGEPHRVAVGFEWKEQK